MAVKVDVKSVYDGKAFEAYKRELKEAANIAKKQRQEDLHAARLKREVLRKESEAEKERARTLRERNRQRQQEEREAARLRREAQRKEAQAEKESDRQLKEQIRQQRREDQHAARLRRELQRKEAQARRAVVQAEKAGTRELKEQIRQQQRLNRLTEKLNRDLKRQADERRRARRQRVERVAGGATAVAAGVGAGVALAAGAVQAADQAQVTESAFRNLSGSAEQAAKNMEAMRRATRDLASEQEQQAIANQLLGMGIVQTSDELEKVVNVSRRLGGTFKGLGARDAAEEFALMISNMSVARLDSFGISSGTVRKRIDELMASTEGMTREQAFFQATMEEADKVLGRIGPELDTTSSRAQEFSARMADLQVAMGELIVTGGDGGVLGLLTGLIEKLTEGANAWQGAIANVGIFTEGLSNARLSILPTIEEIGNLGAAIGNLVNPVGTITDGLSAFSDAAFAGEGVIGSFQAAVGVNLNKYGELTTATIQAVTDNESLGESFEAAAEAAQVEQEALQINTAALQTNTNAVEENSEASEEAAKRMERVASIRRDAAGELLDIEEQLLDNLAEANQDFHEEHAAEVAAAVDRVKDLEEKAAKDRLKISKDLSKGIAKTEKDLAKDLQKIEQDTAKKIKRLQQDAAREDKQESRKRRIDALGDERLFQFELQNLAAEGEALQIIEAQKRREIEKQIESEKQAEEQQTQDEDLQVKIQRLKEDAQDRMREERAQAEERKALLQEQAEEDRALLEERLAEEKAAEEEALKERIVALQANREERVAELQKGREAAIAELGQELAEAKELTQSELQELVTVAGKLGEDVGTSFADGISKGSAKLKNISSLLGEAADFTSPKFAGAGKSKGLGFPGSGFIPGFASGGSFTVGGSGGTDSQLVQFMATPGEQVNVAPPGQTNNISINIPVSGGMSADRIEAMVQRHVQALVNDMEEMMGS